MLARPARPKRAATAATGAPTATAGTPTAAPPIAAKPAKTRPTRRAESLDQKRAGLIAIMETLQAVERKLEGIDRQMVAAGRADATCRHLVTAPGYGPLLSSAMAALVIDPGAFRRSSDFAASLGLVPRQDGSGGKVRLGPISKRGNGYLRRLLVNGATSLIKAQHVRQDPWVAKLLASKPRKVVAVALANKLARIGWALMTRQEDFRGRAVAA